MVEANGPITSEVSSNSSLNESVDRS